MSEQIVVAVIGAMGGVIAASVPQILTLYQASRSNFPTTEGKKGGWPGGDLFEIRELRLLRALVGYPYRGFEGGSRQTEATLLV
jgi:hypothetical protein